MKRALLGVTLVGPLLAACAQQAAQAPQPAQSEPAPLPQPTVAQAENYNLNGGTMTVITEPPPAVRRTTAALDLVQSRSLLDVARKASVRVVNADAGPTSVAGAVAPPTHDVALRIEQTLLGRLGNVFSLAVKVNQIGNPSRAFPFDEAGARELATQLTGAGLKGYALDVRTEALDIETAGGTIENPVERFSLAGQVQARLIDLSTGGILRQGMCRDKQPMGTLREIFVAEGRPVPPSAQATAQAAPQATVAAAGAPAPTDDGSPRPADETSAAALALIEKTDGSTKSQRLEGSEASATPLAAAPAQPEPSQPTASTPTPEAPAPAVPAPSATVETAAAAPAPVSTETSVETAAVAAPAPAAPQPDAATQAVAADAVASVQSGPVPTTSTASVEAASPAPVPQQPAVQPITAQERVQQALRQAAPTEAEIAAQRQAAVQAEEDRRTRQVPIRRTGAFSAVVQGAFDETNEVIDGRVQPRRAVRLEDGTVKQKLRLPSLAFGTLLASQASAPLTLPGPAASGRVSDGAANRMIRKCTEELWLMLLPR
ncbi:MAG: hypothetical protein AAGD13_14480 [Pseudomonadota bacterium]